MIFSLIIAKKSSKNKNINIFFVYIFDFCFLFTIFFKRKGLRPARRSPVQGPNGSANLLFSKYDKYSRIPGKSKMENLSILGFPPSFQRRRLLLCRTSMNNLLGNARITAITSLSVFEEFRIQARFLMLGITAIRHGKFPLSERSTSRE